MSMDRSRHPVGIGDLVDYLLGELPQDEEGRIEDHVFECAACARNLEAVHRIGAAVADAMRHAEIGANVNVSVVTRVTNEGLTVREYRIAPGETVPCAAGPEDFVAVRLSGDFSGYDELTMDTEFVDLESNEQAPTVSRPVLADHQHGEIVLLFPGQVVRSYPRSRWTLTVHGETDAGRRELGTFIMDHSP
jgi:hypothetical protein